MEYLYYKSDKGNFGDDLNGWLWPKFFGDEDISDNFAFLGIGTILYANNKSFLTVGDKTKLVFGSGVRPTHRKFSIDRNWDIRFLRGPLSARFFNNEFKYISDAAYALSLLPEFESLKRITKKYKVSFIPYFKSERYFDWEKICLELGIHYITTHTEKGIEFTLEEIAASEYIISEAMHGAILADIFRIPWRRFVLTTPYTEGELVSEFKWTDWMNSIDVLQHDPLYVPFYKKGRFNSLVKSVTGGKVEAQIFLKNKVRDELMSVLSQSNINYEMSQDGKISEIYTAINGEIMNLKDKLNGVIIK